MAQNCLYGSKFFSVVFWFFLHKIVCFTGFICFRRLRIWTILEIFHIPFVQAYQKFYQGILEVNHELTGMIRDVRFFFAISM